MESTQIAEQLPVHIGMIYCALSVLPYIQTVEHKEPLNHTPNMCTHTLSRVWLYAVIVQSTVLYNITHEVGGAAVRFIFEMAASSSFLTSKSR